MSSFGDDFKIPKLERENYFAWSIRVKAALIQKNCWHAVDPGFDENEMSEAEQKVNQKALSFLFLVVADEYLDDIGNCKRANEAWKILEEINSKFGLLHVILLLKEMVNTTKSREMTMTEYMSKIQNLNRKVASGGFVFDDRTLALFFLMGLPLDTYEGLVRSLEKDEDMLTTKSVKTKLLLEEKRLNREIEAVSLDDGRMAETKALVSKTKFKVQSPAVVQKHFDEGRRKQVKFKTKFVVCFACGKNGHIARNCPARNDTKSESKNDDTAKGNDTRTASVVMRHSVLCVREETDSICNRWILDSGATDHMTPHRDLLQDFVSYEAEVFLASGDKVCVKGRGSVYMKLKDQHGVSKITLTNVLYVPDLEDNLLSISRIENKGFTIVIKDGCMTVSNEGDMVFTAQRTGMLYFIENCDEQSKTNLAVSNEMMLWHKRLGHVHMSAVKNMTGNKVLYADSSDDDNKDSDEKCETCILGKMSRKAFPKYSTSRATQPLDLIHSDVVGKLTPQSLGKACYFVTFIDDFSRHINVYLMHAKCEVFVCFQNYKNKVENKHGKTIKELRSDNGGEYKGEAFQSYLAENGIKQEFTAPYSPQQNGVAERANRTLMTTTRCQLLEAGMPNTFWAESLSTACHARNRCPSRAINGEIPQKLWNSEEPDLSYMRIFGCLAWASTLKKGKLDPRAVKCVFLGYQQGVKAYRLWCLERRSIIISRDVIFEENVFPFKLKRIIEPDSIAENNAELKVHKEEGSENSFEAEARVKKTETEKKETRDITSTSQNDCGGRSDVNFESMTQPVLRRSTRKKKETSCKCSCNLTKMNWKGDPYNISTEEALSGEESEQWHDAMKEEMANLMRNKSWELVRKTDDMKVIGSKWVLTKKYDKHGELARYKARLVAQGCSQTAGVDFVDTYSPVVKIKTIRLLMALSVEMGWEVEHVDIIAAYLNSTLEDTIYMEQPKYFSEPTKDGEIYVCLLRKSIYGLHQSGRNWNDCIDKFLKSIGLLQSKLDPCVYYDPNGDLIITLYVDDLTFFGKKCKIGYVVEKLRAEYEIKILGEVTFLLSLNIERPDVYSLLIGQELYTRDVLDHFNMSESREVKTPLVKGEYYPEDNEKTSEEDYLEETIYRQAIGSLLYLSGGTRPDLSFAVCYLSQFCGKARQIHWTGVKHVLRYLQGSQDKKILYRKTQQPLKVFVDADWASDRSCRKSFSGFVVMLAGGAVVWQTRKQRTVALSTVEAEYVAMSEVTKEVLWIQGFFKEIKHSEFVVLPTKIYADNQGAICLAKNRMTSDRSKHIDVKFHFLRDVVERGDVEFSYVNSNQNLADMFTKTLSVKQHTDNCAEIGLC